VAGIARGVLSTRIPLVRDAAPVESEESSRHPDAVSLREPVRRFRSVQAGSRIGRYRLIERVGQGRQAEVWRALQVETIVQEVALKILRDPAHDPRRLAQLRREAERGARLDSPTFLHTYEYAVADGHAFMAMPLIAGCSLATVLEQRRAFRAGRSTPESHRLATAREPHYTRSVLDLFVRIARGVASAHDAHVVHRDIKPGNILLDQQSGVYLCDFGLGRDLDVATPGQLIDGAGSPLYMAPERLLLQPADEVRCDVYSLALTVTEALTLAPPFTIPKSVTRDQWRAFLVAARPIRLGMIRPDLAGLEPIILRASSKDPVQRHASAAHLADDLERFASTWSTGDSKAS
jgi:serine/threonine-protein kinase